MSDSKADRFKKMSNAVENSDMKSKEKKEQTDQKPQQINKHIKMPKDWADAIKNNHGGTTTSYILTAVKIQLQRDGYI
jgi:hypothetical protein